MITSAVNWPSKMITSAINRPSKMITMITSAVNLPSKMITKAVNWHQLSRHLVYYCPELEKRIP